MQIAILGYDTEGRISYDYYKAQGHELTICDQKTDLEVPADANTVLGDNYLDNLDKFDLLVRTAGLPPQRILEKNPSVGDKITSQVNEFMRVCPTHNIIGVTGTKGKGTTSTLIARILEATGKTVRLGGNIGVPPLSFLQDLDADSWVVLELSSYQLSDLRISPPIALCVMVVPEHLNWHGTFEEYVAAKQQLFAHQSPDDIAVYYADNDTSVEVAGVSKGTKIPYYHEPGAVVNDGAIVIDGQIICRTDELQLLGKHNWQNVCAAVTVVWRITQDVELLRSVITTFTGLPHRLELVRERDGIRYYNDSFASGLHATEAAIDTIEGKKVVIVGGYDRMLPIEHFGPFAAEHADEFRSILLIGASAERTADALRAAGFNNYVINTSATMTEVVTAAQQLAQPGDAIVLSPGFASYDMFKNFEDRGQQYQAVVRSL